MIRKSLCSSSFLAISLTMTFNAISQECDTTMLFGDELITCVQSNCPEDSIVLTYEEGLLRRKRIYQKCKDQGVFLYFGEDGDTLTQSNFIGKKTVGLRKAFFSSRKPKRFTNFNDNGDKHGWEVFWYDNGNVKDSILFRNDSTMKRRSYYYNGKPQMFEDDIYGTYDAVSFNPKGKRTGRIKDGTGTVFLCDSVGRDCKELRYEGGKRVIE